MAAKELYLGSQGSAAKMPACSECDPKHVRIEARERNADASLTVDRFGTKGVWVVKWRGLTTANRNTLKTEYDKTGPLDFIPVDASATYDVTLYGWEEKTIRTGGDLRHHVTIVFEEV